MSTHTVDSTDDYAIYQSSTMAALLAGVYDGDLTIGELLTHGDLGLGTFNHLDGEMVIVDGVCYHLRSDGSVQVADGDDRTPFAAVLPFHATTTFPVEEPTGLAGLTRLIDNAVDGGNIPVALRIDGRFTEVRTRTVGAQTEPYPPLIEATAHQSVTGIADTRGTIAGFRTPQFEQAVSVPGYHLHYVDDAREKGGHVLDVTVAEVTVSLTTVAGLHLALPETDQFRRADLAMKDIAAQEARAEG
ncbi:acetolactate decarboxylase [Rathayibacter sp. AY1F9]|uniref:acetolactate decarboxylase n=1 Tax=Rathayibacter sp. AY1F9 TaxID=2080563 RepID=UPI000CE88974|nr:acetolactate decarboxylase [Rathayibacter sp. AY1F9]PPH28753.1 acetolactate decarboxylase [Rathayibacter sp. AY1F9]